VGEGLLEALEDLIGRRVWRWCRKNAGNGGHRQVGRKTIGCGRYVGGTEAVHPAVRPGHPIAVLVLGEGDTHDVADLDADTGQRAVELDPGAEIEHPLVRTDEHVTGAGRRGQDAHDVGHVDPDP
jgi:hypothetical protein